MTSDNLERALQLLRKVSTMSWRTNNQKYVRMDVRLQQEVDEFLYEFYTAATTSPAVSYCLWHNTGKVNRSGRYVWETSCGKLAAFFDTSKGTVSGLNFCMNCGKPIMVEQVL